MASPGHWGEQERSDGRDSAGRGGPAALVAAIALARRGVRTSVFERDAHPEVARRFNPDRSYTIDISGHGLKALRHIDACAYFDDRMIQFKGLKIPGGRTEEWILPGWTRTIFMDCLFVHSASRARSRGTVSPTPHAGSALLARKRNRCSLPGKKRGAFFARIPRVLELSSDETIATFAQRTGYHISARH